MAVLAGTRRAERTDPRTRRTASVPWVLRLPYPARNMLRRWRGMVGMMVGVGISLSIAMTLFAVGKASIELYTADFLRSGMDAYLVTRGGTLIPVLPSDSPGTIKNARNALAQVRSFPETRAAIGVMTWSLEREREGPRRRGEPAELLAVVGVDGDPEVVPNVTVMKSGRWLRRGDEVVLGEKLSRERGLRVGDEVRISGRDFTVAGVGKLRGVGFSADSMAYMDLRALRDRAGLGDVVNMIVVDTENIGAIRDRAVRLGSLAVFDRDELVAKAQAVSQSSIALNNILSFLALGIAGIFVANVLGQSVSERRLEFATLRAIGIPGRTILLTVGAEAALVGLVAGAIGIAMSLFFGWLINATITVEFGLESLYSADLDLFVQVILLALGLGVGAGLLPARRATRVDPVDVLREA